MEGFDRKNDVLIDLSKELADLVTAGAETGRQRALDELDKLSRSQALVVVAMMAEIVTGDESFESRPMERSTAVDVYWSRFKMALCERAWA
jgi:hypothetical protein